MMQSSAFPPGLVIYQIYPRSFKDDNDDGIGDLAGIISKLDYLADLGITALWICPIYPSPQADFGYDVADYTNVDPIFGSLDQLDQLVREAHSRGIKILLDLVLNHTSDQHPWFKESRSSLDNPKRNWYIWHPGQYRGELPNNWLSTFGGSAWELDEQTNQFYLHSFFKQQPDLNWGNPEVRQALKDVMHFWLERGVDGFRLDAVYWYGKDPSFHNDPVNPDFHPGKENPYDSLLHTHSKRQPSVFLYLNELAQFLKQYPGRFMVTEAYPHEPFNVNSYMEFYKQVDPAVAAPFNFMSLFMPWNAQNYQRLFNQFESALAPNYVPVYVLGNHDRTRLASRIGELQARGAAMLELSLPGAAVIYYGDEIGMTDVKLTGEYIEDQLEKNVPGIGLDRDVARTPMQWSSEKFAGFSNNSPWLPVGQNYQNINVSRELNDPNSLLNLYKKLLSLRKRSPALLSGTYEPLPVDQKNMMAFRRVHDNEKLVIVINFSESQSVPLMFTGETLISTHSQPSTNNELLPLEGRIIRQ